MTRWWCRSRARRCATRIGGSRWRSISRLPRTGSWCPGASRASSARTGVMWRASRSRSRNRGLPIDPGPPPYLDDPVTDAAFRGRAVDVIGYSALLDPDASTTIDIGPATRGNNPVGTDDGTGHAATRRRDCRTHPTRVACRLRAGHRRVLGRRTRIRDAARPLEHPGECVSDTPNIAIRVGGAGPHVDRLEWDVKLYFALNGALHDAAIAAWGARPLRLRASDLVDPLHGWAGQSTDSRPCRHSTPRPPAGGWSRGSGDRRVERTGRAPRSPPGACGEIAVSPGAATRRTRRRSEGGLAGSEPSNGSRTSAPPS